MHQVPNSCARSAVVHVQCCGWWSRGFSAEPTGGVCCSLQHPPAITHLSPQLRRAHRAVQCFAVMQPLLFFLPFSSKPRLLLLPVLCQRNLFSLLHAVAAVVPTDCLRQLLTAAGQDPQPDPWVHALGVLLLRGEERSSPPPPPLTASGQQQLKCLCQKIAQSKAEGRRKLKWCFSKQDGDAAGCVLPGGKRKKVLEESLEFSEEREGKRPLLEDAVFELQGGLDGTAGVGEEVPGETSGDGSAQSLAGAALESPQQNADKEPRRISRPEVAVEVQSFIQVLGRASTFSEFQSTSMLSPCTPFAKPSLPCGEVGAVLAASLRLLGTPLQLPCCERSLLAAFRLLLCVWHWYLRDSSLGFIT